MLLAIHGVRFFQPLASHLLKLNAPFYARAFHLVVSVERGDQPPYFLVDQALKVSKSLGLDRRIQRGPQTGAQSERIDSDTGPWPDPEAFDQARGKGIEAAARQFAATQGLGAVQADQMVARALANGGADGGKAALDAGMLPHELGHLWFTQAFWPTAGQVEDGVSHYGGPGPDWLDALAAVLLEDAPTTDRRRVQMDLLLQGEVVPAIGPVAGRETLLDLKGFLSRPHPALARVQMNAPNLPSGGGIALVYTPAGGGPNPVVQERLFYIQARGFADFLIDKTERATVFADIAQALADGRTFPEWLSTDGATLGLPGSVDGLEELWREGR